MSAFLVWPIASQSADEDDMAYDVDLREAVTGSIVLSSFDGDGRRGRRGHPLGSWDPGFKGRGEESVDQVRQVSKLDGDEYHLDRGLHSQNIIMASLFACSARATTSRIGLGIRPRSAPSPFKRLKREASTVASSSNGFRMTPTTAVLVFVPILTGALGVWQIKRLRWKVKLIEEVDRNMAKTPMILPDHIELVRISSIPASAATETIAPRPSVSPLYLTFPSAASSSRDISNPLTCSWAHGSTKASRGPTSSSHSFARHPLPTPRLNHPRSS
jgi:hypothetical protein